MHGNTLCGTVQKIVFQSFLGEICAKWQLLYEGKYGILFERK